ncbi:MAG: protein-L-isoaspartate(D-aspartate) O-methyltransferase [Rhizomicrobium sp.]
MTAADTVRVRNRMVREQVAARGIHTQNVLDAMRMVPREAFVPARMHEFAYEDAPLPIDANQVISQPYIVALMIDALALQGGETVLEIGTGTGYTAAILAQIAGEVFTVERIEQLAQRAASTLTDLGCHNVHVLHGEGTFGWPDHAPYDAILVAAGVPDVPDALRWQLKIGGSMVVPAGRDPRAQELIRITRKSEDQFLTEDLADIRLVPFAEEEEWDGQAVELPWLQRPASTDRRISTDRILAHAIVAGTEPFLSIDTADLEPLLARIGEARIVLLGEASHGTSEFYRMRARITRALIERKGFNIVAVEADWPDAARIDHYVRHAEYPPSEWTAFARFPTWMWRNTDVLAFVDWLREHNGKLSPDRRTAFRGLDLYSMTTSIRAILDYLDIADPETAHVARQRYGCLTPWQSDPATYGRAALTGRYRTCETEVAHMLTDLLRKRSEYKSHDGDRFLDMIQNAHLVADAEQYYRVMYYGSRESWNLRDTHMFETLDALLTDRGPDSKAVVWAHNSHIGNAAATEMFSRGEHNIGHLCRKRFGESAYLIGFGTNSGTVAAASDWDGPMQIKRVRLALEGSYERLCHETEQAGFLLNLRTNKAAQILKGLAQPRLERAIGVIYRPETELASHYFQAELPRQFDEYIWMDETTAVTPLAAHHLKGLPETYPFGL